MTTDYDAVVYDLDGTLVRLAVDWAAAADRIAPIVRDHGGEADAIEPELAAAECEGARDSERLPTMDEFVEATVPVGICSLNCEAACHEALATHGIERTPGAVVGRDSVTERKPHPEPLLTAVERLGATPERTLFVGDSDSDAVTARRAGTDFRRV